MSSTAPVTAPAPRRPAGAVRTIPRKSPATAPTYPTGWPGGGRLFGYARVSTAEQNLDHQVDQLTAAGVAAERVFTETASGALTTRRRLDELLGLVQPADVIVVVRLDRLGRSLPHLVALVADLTARGIGVRALAQPIDTTTQAGQSMVGLFAWLAETERAYLIERTRDGLAAASARGRHGGRPTVMSPERLRVARELLDAGTAAAVVARTLGIGRTTLYRHVRPPAA